MKNVIIVIIIFVFIVCLNTQAIFGEKEDGFEFNTIAKGHYSGIADSRNLIIKDIQTWQEAWEAHASIRLPRPELPNIDFTEKLVIAVFNGERSTGGYTLEIDKIERMDDKIRVYICKQKPGPGLMVTQAFTQPHHIIEIEKSDLPIEFVYIEREIK